MKIKFLLGLVLSMTTVLVSAQTGTCKTFSGEEDSIRLVENYSIYRDAVNLKTWDDGVYFWRIVYTDYPGFRKQPFIDGEKFMEHKIKNTKDTKLKLAYIDTLFQVYEKRMECHGDSAKVMPRMATKYYKYRSKGKENVTACLSKFKETIDLGVRKHSTLKYYFYTAAKAAAQEAITKEEALNIFLEVNTIIEEEIAKKPSDKLTEAKADIQKKLGSIIESCEDAQAILGPEYTKNPDDEGLWQLIYNVYASQKGDCIKDQVFVEVTEKLYSKDSNAVKGLFLAKYYTDVDKAKAEAYYTAAVASAGDDDTKADYLMEFAGFYKEKGLYSNARTKALEAANLKANWGEPYYFIGVLYASSGKLCGSGTGWDSQTVTWVAIDMFVKAKTVDPSIADKVNPLINKYKANYPLGSDAFMRQLKDGDPYKVGCWIQRNTTVRTQK